jgi:hypothetical protein
MRKTALWAVLGASTLLLFVIAWVLIPAPNELLLLLAVAAAELSPVLLAAGALLSGLAAVQARRL